LNNKHRRIVFPLLATAIFLTACAQPTETEETIAKGPNLDDADQKVAYSIGASTGKTIKMSLETLDGTGIKIDTETLITGFIEGLKDTSQLDDEAIKIVMNDLRTQMTVAQEEKRKIETEAQTKAGAAYLAENTIKADVTTLESGLQYQVLTAGSGKSPGINDRVTVHYSGTLIDGTQFDSSYDRGEPATFAVTGVIRGWTEALQLMKEGAKWQLTIPAELAYGQTGRPSIPGNAVLLFDVELLEIVE
jgi:FKBP-type peptidyl-prolyl cis-trans isomerase FkpA